MAVDHKGLRSREPEAVAGADRLELGVQRAMFRALVDRKRGEQASGRDLRQMLGLLRRAAAARQRGRGEHRGGQERRRHQGAADLLHHDAGLDEAEAAAAEFFRHKQAGKSHLGETLPELAGKAGGVLGSRASCRRCDTGALSEIRPRALSRSIDCSSVRTRAMMELPTIDND